ncbi:hypothetical protein B4Q13_20900 [Lacticaseibacillus rhamnosus]
MSPKAVERLQAAIAKIMREPAMAERMATLGMDLQENGTATYTHFMHDDLELSAKVIDRIGLSRTASKTARFYLSLPTSCVASPAMATACGWYGTMRKRR